MAVTIPRDDENVAMTTRLHVTLLTCINISSHNWTITWQIRCWPRLKACGTAQSHLVRTLAQASWTSIYKRLVRRRSGDPALCIHEIWYWQLDPDYGIAMSTRKDKCSDECSTAKDAWTAKYCRCIRWKYKTQLMVRIRRIAHRSSGHWGKELKTAGTWHQAKEQLYRQHARQVIINVRALCWSKGKMSKDELKRRLETNKKMCASPELWFQNSSQFYRYEMPSDEWSKIVIPTLEKVRIGVSMTAPAHIFSRQMVGKRMTRWKADSRRKSMPSKPLNKSVVIWQVFKPSWLQHFVNWMTSKFGYWLERTDLLPLSQWS